MTDQVTTSSSRPAAALVLGALRGRLPTLTRVETWLVQADRKCRKVSVPWIHGGVSRHGSRIRRVLGVNDVSVPKIGHIPLLALDLVEVEKDLRTVNRMSIQEEMRKVKKGILVGTYHASEPEASKLVELMKTVSCCCSLFVKDTTY